MLGAFSPYKPGTGRFTFVPSKHLTPDTRVIGANALLAFVEASEKLGYARKRVLRGLDYRIEDLRKWRARVSWRELTQSIENAERAGMTQRELERAGEDIAASPHLLTRHVVDFFLRPEHLFYIGLRWIAPATFPVFDTELEYRGPEMRLRLEIPPALGDSAAYFRICKGTLAAVPTGIGQPKARVSAAIGPRSATFDIHCAPFERGAVRLGRIARALLTVPRVIETIVEQETAIRRGLDAALDSESQYLGILGALPDGVVIFRHDSIVFMNPALARALGHERASELIGTSWSRFAPPGARECRIEKGECKFVALELSPPQRIEFEGQPAELVIARDVTERTELKNQLALADRMASLSTVAAGLAHEINNPLALVINNLELATRDGDAKGYLEAASEGAERVREIVRELRIFAQPEPETPALVDLGEVVESTVALARGKVSSRATLRVEIRSVPPVAGSRGKLGQVLLNLIINALEALPADRAPSENRIVVRLISGPTCVRIEVEDNGSGIPEPARAHVFEPFFSARRGGGGSGLGLSVARDIVSRNGGQIRFASIEGAGTTFIIELPLADAARAEAARTDSPDSAGRAARILIADDEPSLVRALESALVQERHEVVSAASGREAIDEIERNANFDLILCDLMMPDGSGADVYAHVRQSHPELAARIVFMTGGTFPGQAREFLRSVENPCLDKPFRLDELTRLVATALTGGWTTPVRV